MKILLVTTTFYPNTAATNRNKATVRGFQENGCQCDVFSIRPIVTEETICLNKHIVPRNEKLLTALWTLTNLWRLRNIIQEYDVILCGTYTMSIVKTIVRQAKKYQKLTLHERTELPDILSEIEGSSNDVLQNYLKQVRGFDRLLVISHPIKDYFVQNGVPAEKIDIFPMIVDPHRFDGVKKQVVEYRYIAYCGNMNNSKDGIDNLIEAYGLSTTRTTHKLMLIGSKPTGEQLSRYTALIEKYSLQDDVIFRGQVARDDMPQLLMNADLLVLCRPDNRQALGGFPTKLGEYLSTGNPVLVTRVGDIDKYVVDGENGYLAQPDDIKGFSTKMDAIMADYEKAQAVGHRGRELALDAFNYKVQTKKVIDIVDKELKK